jgi:hypothetical protein
MRMWQIDPKLLCRNHLLGEHSEIHKYRPSFEKHHSIHGRVFPIVLIEPSQMEHRHNELVVEMLRRGYNHNSPYTQPDIRYLPLWQQNVVADREYNCKDLMLRCKECKKRITEYTKGENNG